ncbi:MAG: hypothetical protein ACOCP8_06235 [archaeon]
MIKTEHEKEYCMKCGKLIEQSEKKCECGSKNFIFGDNFVYTKCKATCDCGNDKFQMISHVNRSPVYNKTYSCSECGNTIGIQTYYKSPYY